MDEDDLPYEELFNRCGTELSDKQVQDIKEKFAQKANSENIVLGTLEVGTVLDGYTIIEYLGAGGFGTVCMVRKKDLFFAMKLMLVKNDTRSPPPEFKQLYKALVSPEHQSLLTALEWKQFKSKESKQLLECDGEGKEKLCYMIMKLAGPSLDILLNEQIEKEGRPIPLLIGIPIMRNALRSLQVFHDRRLVHHDIKLDNFAMDLSDENRILLLDYGMARLAIRNFAVAPGFEGTRFYASRRALKEELQSYRDDYESWFYALLEFINGDLPWTDDELLLEKKETFWSEPDSIDDKPLIQILKHIDHLGFYETINYEFVDGCLHDLIAEQNGVTNTPYIYKQSYIPRFKVIKKGAFTFTADKPDTKGRMRFYCGVRSCLFTIYVEKVEYEKAKEDDEAIIIDTKNNHTCLEM